MAKATKRKATRLRAGAAKVRAVGVKAKKAKVTPRKVARKAKPVSTAPLRQKISASPEAAARAFARRIIELTVSNDDEATYALYAADVESKEMGQPPVRGVPAISEKFAGWRQMVSDARFEPRRVAVDGNTIVIEWIGHETLAGSGKQAELHEVAIHEIRDGKIVREAFFYNPAALA